MEKKNCDIAIIGSGPGGYTAAIRANQLGKSVICIEKDRLGGICLNWGCIPTKALIKSAEAFHTIKNSDEFGFSVGSVEVNFNKIIGRSREVSERQEKGVGFLFKKNKIESIKGNAKITSDKMIIVDTNEGDIHINPEKIIIATGGRPKSLPGIEIDQEYIISSKEAMTLNKQPKNLIIIGAGAIGIEFGYFYSTIGTEVTIIEALPHLLPLEDEEISKALEREFKKQKINFKTSSLLKNIDKTGSGGVLVEYENTKKNKIETIEGDIVLMAIGVTGNIEDIGLEDVGINTEKGFIIANKETYKTNIDGIYAIGDVIGPPLLAHVASHEGIACVEKICGIENPTNIDYNIIPACTYSNPQVANVGMTEKEAKDNGYEIKKGKYSFLANGKAHAIGESKGLIKVIFDKESDKLLGCHIVGPEATELIAELSLAMHTKVTAEDIIHTIHAHPTLSEGVMEASANAYGKSINV